MNPLELLLQGAIEVIALFMPIIVVALVGWLVKRGIELWYGIKAYLPSEVADMILTAARIGVDLAEQLANNGIIDLDERKQTAMETAERWLRNAGYDDIDLQPLDDAIEATVRQLKREEFGIILEEE